MTAVYVSAAATAWPLSAPAVGARTLAAKWQTEGDQAGKTWELQQFHGEPILVCPALDRRKTIALKSPPFPHEPWHRYRLKIDWRGGLFFHWSVHIRYRLIDGRVFEQLLFPERDSAAPSPNWAARVFEFITPSDAAESRIVVTVKADTDRGYRPALRAIELKSLGREPVQGDPPGSRAPRAVTEKELAERGGGWGYLKRDSAGRHILNQAGASVNGAGVVLASIWARGDGRMRLTARMGAAARGGRFFDFASPEWKLTDDWREYAWEVPILFTAVKNVSFQLSADVYADGPFELDEPFARALQSSRPPPLAYVPD